MNYDALAEEIRRKRVYSELDDGTILCDLAGCAGSTGLRCNRTSVPICKTCAVRTPTGYISREMAKQLAPKKTFREALSKRDYLKLAGVLFFQNFVVGGGLLVAITLFFDWTSSQVGVIWVKLPMLLALLHALWLATTALQVGKNNRTTSVKWIAFVAITLSTLPFLVLGQPIVIFIFWVITCFGTEGFITFDMKQRG